MIKIIGIKRRYININWEELKKQYPKMKISNIECIKRKWNPFRDDWKQGFDSDCFSHCSQHDICTDVFYHNNCKLDNHLKTIIVLFEEIPCKLDEEIKIIEE